MNDSDLQELQAIVHRKLGRFLLRVQRYEMLLKALVIDSVAFGTVETAPLNQQRRKELFGSKPMGYLFDEIKRTYLRELGAPAPEEAEEPHVDPDKPVFRTRFALELPAEELEQTRARLDEFKELRNRIVHHFLEDHDLLTQVGCQKAITVLEEGLATAQSSYEDILQWAKTAIEAQKHFAAFVQSPEFDQLFHGILPDGTVDWPNSTAVVLLRRQEQNTAPGEMTRLDTALEAIRATHPEHRPPKYFCQNWSELLRKSGQFHVRKERGSVERQGITWYRSLGPTELR
ncbi:hypothetical protein LJR290_007061 [Variovorax sp. LjRoot290]|uniref:hypothetical protein n=1 Tax=unclassified Variovorax TaxID=663243 RepID=UPI003ED0F2BC